MKLNLLQPKRFYVTYLVTSCDYFCYILVKWGRTFFLPASLRGNLLLQRDWCMVALAIRAVLPELECWETTMVGRLRPE